MKKINIAVDGHSACGKSTTAKAMAKFLGYRYVDSGAMYRAVTLYFIKNNITLTNPKSIDRALEDIVISFELNTKTGGSDTFLNGLRVENEIRLMEVTEAVSEVSALTPVRKAMVKQQKKFAKRGGVIMDGRDIGTVVLPNAELKIFMTADVNVRALRRQKELIEKDQILNFDVVKRNLQRRDKIDSSREDSPLMQADDALIIDTTYLTLDEQIEEGLMLATTRMLEQFEKETIQ
jgi:cytidylate kinase